MRFTIALLALTLTSFVAIAVQAQNVDQATAQKQFGKYCAKCHGAEGRGDGPEGATLQHRPKTFTDCAEMAKEDDEKLFAVIKFGGESQRGQRSEMPAMGKALSDEEISGLLAYVRSLCRQQRTAETSAGP